MSYLDSLAQQFVQNTVKVQSGEGVWIEWEGDNAKPLAQSCMTQINSLGGTVYAIPRGGAYYNSLLASNPSEAELIALGQERLETAQKVSCFISIRDVGDVKLNDGLDDLLMSYGKHVVGAYGSYIAENTRFIVVNAPTEAFARACGMGFDEFKTFYTKACLLDYSKMQEPAGVLEQILRDGKKVRISGKDTELEFSIDGIDAMASTGTLNLPDGEVFTAPVKGSVNGHVVFGPSVYGGNKFDEIRLVYRDGKVVKAESTNKERTNALNKILDTDEGARYPGEFALAFNPVINEPVGDILFDEKINGSFHIAQGSCYTSYADNGNDSDIHWDMVQIQRPEHGGGIIEIDGRVIRRDGEFIVPELQGLNPPQLL